MTYDKLARRDFVKATGAGVGVGLFAGCMGDNGSSEGEYEDGPITIAGLQPMSGPYSAYGPTHSAGAEFAAERINENGGVLGREIEVNNVDTGGEPETGGTTYVRQVEQENAVAAIGPVDSDLAILVSQRAEEYEVPVFVHAAGSQGVVSRDDRYTFRTTLPPAPIGAQAQAEIIEERGFDEIGVILGDDAWGHGWEQSIEEYFPDDVSVHMEMAPMGESDFSPYLRSLPDSLDMMVGSAHPAGKHSMYNQMLELGLEPELFMGATTPGEASFGAIGEEITGSFRTMTHFDVFSEEYRSLAQEFGEETGDLFDFPHAAGYVTVELIAAAIEEADSAYPTDVADAVRNISLDTILSNPLEYTDWGEPDNLVQMYVGYELEAPEFYPEGEFSWVEDWESGPIPAYDPDELPLE